MKTCYLTVSQVFPATHPRKGEPTYFKEQVLNAVFRNNGWDVNSAYPDKGFKLHTLRGNYERWEKIFAEIYTGNACLSLRVWSGRPYHSKMIEIARLTKEDGIGLQRLQFIPINGDLGNFITSIDFRMHRMPEALNLAHELASNDGLSFADWKGWFFGRGNYDFKKPMAIIHFTKFRY